MIYSIIYKPTIYILKMFYFLFTTLLSHIIQCHNIV